MCHAVQQHFLHWRNILYQHCPLTCGYWALEGSAQPPSSLWSLPTPTCHSSLCIQSTVCTLLLILIFYFFLFKNRGVFSLYLPQSLMNFFAIHLFIEWAQILQFLTKKTHSSYKDLQFQGCNLAIFWALNLLYQVLFEPLLTTEINCFEWFWLCIAGSYEKDCFFRRCLSTFLMAVLQFIEKVTAVLRYFKYCQPQVVKCMRTLARGTHEFKRKKLPE